LSMNFRHLTFTAYTTGCGTPIVYMGKYTTDISSETANAVAGVMTATFTTVTSNSNISPGMTFIYNWVLTESFLNVSSFELGVQDLYYQPDVTPIDGTWSWTTENGTLFNEIDSGLSMSFIVGPTLKPPVMLLGPYELTGDNISMEFAFGPEGFPGTAAVGSYTLDDDGFTVDMFVEADGTEYSLQSGTLEPPNSMWEGAWIGSTSFQTGGTCLTNIEFRQNIWRSVQTQCSGTDFTFGTFLGFFDSQSSKDLELTIVFMDIDGKGDNGSAGQTVNFEVDMVDNMGMVEVLIMSDGSTVQLTKVQVIRDWP